MASYTTRTRGGRRRYCARFKGPDGAWHEEGGPDGAFETPKAAQAAALVREAEAQRGIGVLAVDAKTTFVQYFDFATGP